MESSGWESAQSPHAAEKTAGSWLTAAGGLNRKYPALEERGGWAGPHLGTGREEITVVSTRLVFYTVVACYQAHLFSFRDL